MEEITIDDITFVRQQCKIEINNLKIWKAFKSESWKNLGYDALAIGTISGAVGFHFEQNKNYEGPVNARVLRIIADFMEQQGDAAKATKAAAAIAGK